MESLGYLVNAYFQATDGLFRTRVGIAGAAGVIVGPSCDGVVLFALFAIFCCILSRALASKSVVHPAGNCCDSCGQCLSNHLLALDSIVFRRRCHDVQSRLHLHGVCVQHHFLVVVPLRGERRGGKTVDAFHGRKRTSAVKRVSKPMLPRKRPFWLLVLAVMLVFGFYQEKAKIQLNHYTQVMEANPELEAMPSEMRAQWWHEPSATAAHPLLHHAGNVVRVSRHESDATGEIEVGDEPCYFGGLFRLGWAVFSKTTGHLERWPWLVVMYGLAGGIMARFHCAGTRQVGLQRGARVFGILTVAASVAVHCAGALAH